MDEGEEKNFFLNEEIEKYIKDLTLNEIRNQPEEIKEKKFEFEKSLNSICSKEYKNFIHSNQDYENILDLKQNDETENILNSLETLKTNLNQFSLKSNEIKKNKINSILMKYDKISTLLDVKKFN